MNWSVNSKSRRERERKIKASLLAGDVRWWSSKRDPSAGAVQLCSGKRKIRLQLIIRMFKV